MPRRTPRLAALWILGLLLFVLSPADGVRAQTGGRVSAAAASSSAPRTRGKSRATKRATRSRTDKTVDDQAEDVTDSSHALEPRAWQVEIAWSLQSIRGTDDIVHEMTAPQALVRYGVSRRFELRLSADGLLSDATRAAATPRVTGMSDIELAGKLVLQDEGRGAGGFGLGLIPGVSLPIGSRAFTSGGVDSSLTLVWDHKLPRATDASGSVSIGSVTDHDRRFTQTAAGLSLGHDLPAGFSGFADFILFSALTRDGTSASFADVGVEHHLGRFSLVDVSIGRRLHGPAPSWVISAGLAMRTPRRKPHVP